MLDVSAAKARDDPRLDALLLRQEVEDFNAAYAAALDEQRLADWVEMFTDDAFYVVISRENADRGHAGRIDLLRQQADDLRPRLRAGEDGDVRAALPAPHHRQPADSRRGCAGHHPRAGELRVVSGVVSIGPTPSCTRSAPITTYSAGSDGALKLAERRCVYDNLLIDNALCLPV